MEGKMPVHVKGGDITKVASDALVTFINSEGYWFGGLDSAIMRVAGNSFHAQLAVGLKHGMKDDNSFFAEADKLVLPFKAVLFTIDDLQKPVSELVYQSLLSAHVSHCKAIACPAFRLGVMRGVVEKSVDETIAGIKAGIDDFAEDQDHTMDITFVIWNDMEILTKMEKAFNG